MPKIVPQLAIKETLKWRPKGVKAGPHCRVSPRNTAVPRQQKEKSATEHGDSSGHCYTYPRPQQRPGRFVP